jgi:glycosyltransferase involved in cell wall biosynthesis
MRNALSARSATRTMRIVLASEPTGGGVGRHVLDLAEGLPRRGFRVLLVHARHGVDRGFSTRMERNAQYGYETASIDVRRAPGRHDLGATLALRQAIRRFGGADVLHGHSSKAGALARLARWLRARRVVYTPNGWYTQNPELSRTSRRAYQIIERTLAIVTDRIIAVSSDEAEHAVGLGIAAHKLEVIENGIEPWAPERVARARADTRARLGIAPDDMVVGFLGRLAPQKAPEVAVRTLKLLLDARPSVRVVFAGDGPEGERVDVLLQELGLGDRLIRLPEANGPEVIPAFDVFLMTSRYEGFPYVLLEALAAGCAIVTTRVGGVRDCVLDGVNGHVVDTLDPYAIAERAIAITGDADLLGRMRAQARARAANFSIDRMIDRTADLYRSLHEAS